MIYIININYDIKKKSIVYFQNVHQIGSYGKTFPVLQGELAYKSNLNILWNNDTP